MKRFMGGLGALGVLAAIWGVLIGVGFAFGALKPLGSSDAAREDAEAARTDGGANATADASARDGSAASGLTSAATTTDAHDGPDGSTSTLTAATLVSSGAANTVARTIVCDANTRRPGLALVQLTGDARPELAVLCGRSVQILALESRDVGGALLPVRVATFELATDSGEPDTELDARAVAAGDVDGDGAPDVVLGFADPTEHARGGALFLVSRDGAGGFARPRSLGPIVAIAAAIRALDERPGAEILALHRAQAASRRASEVWVFGGGAAPSRVALQRVGIGAEAFAIADLDRDGHDDVLVTTSGGPRVDVLFGDGATAFPRSREFAVRGAREAVAGDVDGDGAVDVVLGGEATLFVRAVEGTDAVEARPIEAAHGLRLLAAGDVGADGARELVGYLHPEIVAFTGLSSATPTRRTLRILHADEPMPVALAVGDLDADGHAELVTLARVSEDAPFEVVIVPVGTAPFAHEAEPLREAPLTLHVMLH